MTDGIQNFCSDSLYSDIRTTLTEARRKAMTAVNSAMIDAYWNVGKLIVEAQGGSSKAAYGTSLIENLAKRLTKEFGKGFTATNLKYMRQFYLVFPIRHTVCDKLSWSHIRLLLRVSNPKAREYYATEAANAPWSVRQLERQIHTQSFERLLSTYRDESSVQENKNNYLPVKPELFDALKLVHDPYVLEFLDIRTNCEIKESDLENAIISHLEQFLLELGRGFAFIGRQKRFTIGNSNYYPDLVFYNVITKSYVIIDLKIGKADYADIGQMQLYVNYFNMEVCTNGDNPTIGIVLCAEKDDAVVKYTLGDRKDIGVFASEYRLYLPTEDELKRELEISRENFRLIQNY